MNTTRRPRLAVFISHPIQHFSPLFRELARTVDLQVFYFSHFGQIQRVDPGFGVPVQWDVPLIDGYAYTYLPTVPGLDPAYIGPLRVNRGLLKSFKQMEWDAAWIFGYSSINAWLIWLLAQLRRVPLLYTSDSELLQHRSWLKRVLKDIPVRLFLGRVTGYLAVGDNNAAYGRYYGVNAGRIWQFAYPVDVARFQAIQNAPDFEGRRRAILAAYQIPPGAKVVLFCGKLIPRKRPLDLVHALKHLAKQGLPAVGVFLGTGALEETIRQAGQAVVRITGFVNQRDIPVYYALADVLVMPSEIDPHPLTVTEAGSLGIPSIVSDKVGCVGPTDMLRPGENGLVYPCGDVSALAATINSLLIDDALRAQFGARARELAELQSVQMAARHVQNALERVMRRRVDSHL